MNVAPSADNSGAEEMARLATIARVAASKGWTHYAQRLRSGRGDDEPAGVAHGSDDAVRLREALEELGPTFVKFGQMLAQRDDLLPAVVIDELKRLHDDAGSFPAASARQIIEAEIGFRIDQIFVTFDDRPIAAASMAQVHRATLHDGMDVIVKVQRPDIEQAVEGDISVLRRLARLLSPMHVLRPLNLRELVEEFAVTLRGELDFEQEGRNAQRFAETNRYEPLVFVPRIYWEATTRRVLTMERSIGARIDRAEASSSQRTELANGLMRLFLTQVFEHGVFHADPHPGNLFLLPDGRICFHDFGAIGELSPRLQESLRHLFLAVMARDPAWVASAYLGMGGASAELDRGAFTADLSAALDRYYRQAEDGAQSLGAILKEFVELGRRHRIRLLRETTLLMRAFAELESVLRTLDPEFRSLDAFRAYSARLLKHAFLPRLDSAQLAHAYRIASAIGELAGETPIALRRLVGRLERGEPLFEIRHQSGGSFERHLLHASNRLAFALIIASVVIGSSMLLTAHAGPHWEQLPVLGVVAFIVAVVLGIAWAALALRSGKL